MIKVAPIEDPDGQMTMRKNAIAMLRRAGYEANPLEKYPEAAVNSLMSEHTKIFDHMGNAKWRREHGAILRRFETAFTKLYGEDVHIKLSVSDPRRRRVAIETNLTHAFKESGGRLYGVTCLGFDGLYFTTHSIDRLCQRLKNPGERRGVYYRFLDDLFRECRYGTIEIGTGGDDVVIKSSLGHMLIKRVDDVGIVKTFYEVGMTVADYKRVCDFDCVEIGSRPQTGLITSLKKVGL